MNDLPRQKLREIIVQHGRALCDDPKRCEAFLRDYCGQYGREIFILISALKKGVAKDILDSSNIPVELLLGRLTKQMQNDLGLTEEAARYAVESWAMVLDKMPPQQIQQPIIKPPTTISRNQQPILESVRMLVGVPSTLQPHPIRFPAHLQRPPPLQSQSPGLMRRVGMDMVTTTTPLRLSMASKSVQVAKM